MNERERAILRGKPITPQTEDEAALKYAVENSGGGPMVVQFVHSSKTGGFFADKTIDEIQEAANRGDIIIGRGANILFDDICRYYLDTVTESGVSFRAFDGRGYMGDKTSGTDVWTRHSAD